MTEKKEKTKKQLETELAEANENLEKISAGYQKSKSISQQI